MSFHVTVKVPVENCAVNLGSCLTVQCQEIWQDLPTGEQCLSLIEISHHVICSLILLRLQGRKHHERSMSWVWDHSSINISWWGLKAWQEPCSCQVHYRERLCLAVSAPLLLSPGSRSSQELLWMANCRCSVNMWWMNCKATWPQWRKEANISTHLLSIMFQALYTLTLYKASTYNLPDFMESFQRLRVLCWS